jgi:hypothetical protein
MDEDDFIAHALTGGMAIAAESAGRSEAELRDMIDYELACLKWDLVRALPEWRQKCLAKQGSADSAITKGDA